ncbi:MAG: hypothetical protein ACYC33_08110 [Thermoleophilia bacterium]
MIAILEDKREAVAILCRRYGVARLYVFGSALREDYRPGKKNRYIARDIECSKEMLFAA